MTRIAAVGAILVLAAGLGLAETWTGKLVDATCAAKGESSAPHANQCAPTRSTKSFGIELPDGKVYKLDASGNTKASEAMKTNPRTETVTINGQLDGQTVKVDSINLQ